MRITTIALKLFIAAGCAFATPLYTVTDLGVNTRAFGINNSSQVVGYVGPFGHNQPFLYSGGTLSLLANLPGFTAGIAFAINDAGQIAGGSGDTGRAFLYSGGVLHDLGTLGGLGTVATALNASGMVVGLASSGTGDARGFLYNGGALQPLGILPGTVDYSFAYGINNAGQIVGIDLVGSKAHAVIFAGASAVDIGTLPGGNDAQALAINNLGQIVGNSNGTGIPDTEAFLYQSGMFTDLGRLPGSIGSMAMAINNFGVAVGRSDENQALLFSGGHPQDLNTLIDPSLGVALHFAPGINDRGQIIAVGAGPDSSLHSYLLTPAAVPEPGTFGAVAGSLIALAVHRRRRSKLTS